MNGGTRLFPVLRRNPDTAAEIERILGLPHDRWGDLKLEATNNGPATVTVELFINTTEFLELAALAVRHPAEAQEPDLREPL